MQKSSYYLGSLLLLLGLGVWGGCGSLGGGSEPEPYLLPRVYIEAFPQREGTAGVQMVTIPGTGSRIPIRAIPVMTETDFARVDAFQVDDGMCLGLTTTNRGRMQLLRVTADNVGRRLVFTVNGEAIGSRLIDGTIGDGMLFTFVGLPDEELPTLAENLSASLEYYQTKEAR